MRKLHRDCCLAAVAAIVACDAGGYVYAPRGATSAIGGYPSARVAIPPEQPTGEVSVASFGLTTLDSPGANAVGALHVRIVADNLSGEVPWTIDTREQLVEIAGEGRSRAIFVNTDLQAPPLVTVEPRQRRVLDLYFPLPSTVSGATDLAEFDLLWQVRAGDRVVAQRSTFARFSTEPEYGSYGYSYGYGYFGGPYAGWAPYWWHDPSYWHGGFAHHHRVVFSHPHHVTVTHAPRGHFGVSHHGHHGGHHGHR
jgi:hypothetical protein